MNKRLAIASEFLGNPVVLVFYEPTNVLDPVGILEIRELIQELAQQGKTIIMASHLLDEVEKVCSHVAIMKRGKLLTSGKVSEILSNEEIVELSAENNESLYQILSSYPNKKSLKNEKQFIELSFAIGDCSLSDINKYCFENGLVLNHLTHKKKSLESKFFELTNN
jgi:ABC-2 type transport system ATP-binding protein